MNVQQATRAYETWLRSQVDIVEPDLRLKHERMAESPFVFLRATYYRWIQTWATLCPAPADAPRVDAVGDLHIENFGTWRDAEGRLAWGINDVDEACKLPYTQDLVRLAASAWLAIEAGHFVLTPRAACDAILDGYRTSLARNGRPLVLAERRRWLRLVATNDLRDPEEFWAKLLAGAAVNGGAPAKSGAPRRLLERTLPRGATEARLMRRVAGVGSLGRPRFVALAEVHGGLIAREAKAFVPSASVWAGGEAPSFSLAQLLQRAVRAPDPFFTIQSGWILRRLAPDCSRIELADLPKRHDEARLLRAMGWETANVHLGSLDRRVSRDAAGRPRRWLERAAEEMAQATTNDWRDFVASSNG